MAQGTGYVYETLLRPYIAKHETDIDRTLVEWKAKVWDLVVFHMQNWTQFGQSAFVQGLQYLASQSTRFQNNASEVTFSLCSFFPFSMKSHIIGVGHFHGDLLFW